MEPPKTATWLLRHFGCSPNNDALIGDLNERYRRGHSGIWYWTQVLRAIVISLAQEIGGHKLLTACAVTIGWVLLLLGMILFRALVATLNAVVRSSQSGFLREMLISHRDGSLIGLIAVSWAGWTGIGWILKRLFQPHQRVGVLTFVVTAVTALVIATLAVSTQRPVSAPQHEWASIVSHPLLVGFGGNAIGLISVLMGSGLLSYPSRDSRVVNG
jgi:hypothetical protein